MRRLFGWMAGLVGIAALARVLAARRSRELPAPTTPPEVDPAAALRKKLSESRDEPAASPEPSEAVSVPVEPESLDERRARVHAKAQEAMDAMDAELEPPA